MIHRVITVCAATVLAVLATGCTSDQLTAFGCTFDNDPYAPRSPECLAVDRQQETNAEIRRLDRQIARERERAEAERARRDEALNEAIATLAERVAALPDPAPLFQSGDYHGAYLASEQRRRAVLDVEGDFIVRNADDLANARELVGTDMFLYPDELKSIAAQVYGNHSWYVLFDPSWNSEFGPSDRFSHAAISARSTLRYDPTQRWVRTNLAHALMFQGQVEEADEIYLDGIGEYIEGGQAFWEEIVADDFKQLRAAGITHPHMDVVLASFAAASGS